MKEKKRLRIDILAIAKTCPAILNTQEVLTGKTLLSLLADKSELEGELFQNLVRQCQPDLTLEDNAGNTVLHEAIAHQNVTLVQFLVEHIDIDATILAYAREQLTRVKEHSEGK